MNSSLIFSIMLIFPSCLYSMSTRYALNYQQAFRLTQTVRLQNNLSALKNLLSISQPEQINDIDKQLALYTATQQGCVAKVQLLLAYGIRPTQVFIEHTAFTWAVKALLETIENGIIVPLNVNYRSILKLFLSLPDLDVTTTYGDLPTLYRTIIQTQDPELLQLLLNHPTYNTHLLPRTLS